MNMFVLLYPLTQSTDDGLKWMQVRRDGAVIMNIGVGKMPRLLNVWATATLCTLFLLGTAQPANAIQTGIRLGIFQTQADTREDTEFSMGLDVLLYRSSQSSVSVSANWLTIREKSGSEANLYPIFLNLKYKIRQYPSSFLYIGVGGGIYFPDSEIPTMGIKKEVKGAWNTVFGVEFTGPRYMSSFIEGGYMASEDPGKSGLWHLEWGIRY